MDRFTKISQTKIDANLDRFNKGIDPNLTLEVYTRKQELFQERTSDLGVSISKETMVRAGTKNAIATGRMEVVWRKWMCTIDWNSQDGGQYDYGVG